MDAPETVTTGPQRGRTVFAIGVGEAMDDEWETARVPQALRRLVSAAQPYAREQALSVVYFGSRAKVGEPTTLERFGETELTTRPTDCGPGANLAAAIYGALSQRQGNERLHVYVVSDCNVADDELERAKHAIAHAPNLVVMLVRVSTDAEGMQAAYELDEFRTGNEDSVGLIHYTDGRGRDVGANLDTHVGNRMSVILARHYATATAV